MGKNDTGGRHGLRAAAAAAGMALMLLSSGCGERELEQPYSFEERGFSVEEALSSDDTEQERAELFAADLCVVMDESVFSGDELSAEAGAVFDLTDGATLYSKNAFERLYPASITKVMTALLAIKYGSLSDMVTVTEDAVITEPGATLCGIHPGDQLTLEQLLYGLMLPSGNDAGAAIAVHMAGSVEAFAEMMNREAESLGATQTHFVNPHGLTDEEHYTTAYDLYLIFQEALKLPEFCEITGAVSYEAVYVDASGAEVRQTWNGTNQYMIGKREPPEGITVFSGKTGTTSAAGSCLIIASRDDTDGDEFISVVLKAPDRNSLYENMTRLLDKAAEKGE